MLTTPTFQTCSCWMSYRFVQLEAGIHVLRFQNIMVKNVRATSRHHFSNIFPQVASSRKASIKNPEEEFTLVAGTKGNFGGKFKTVASSRGQGSKKHWLWSHT